MEASREDIERTPRGQGSLLRQRLIDATLALLDEGSDPATISIRGVTRKAGVSPTAFYLHFDSHEQLIREVIEHCFTDFRTMLNAATAQTSDPWQRLVDAGVAYMGFAREQPARYRLIFSADWEVLGIEEGEDSGLEVADAAFADLIELIAAYVGSNIEDPAELDVLGLGLWAGLHGYATLCHSQPSMAVTTDEQYASLLAKTWLGPKSGV
ncbi:MAG: TetR/AcrR family transcriptional regulator [Solirubrobacterales bacterium]